MKYSLYLISFILGASGTLILSNVFNSLWPIGVFLTIGSIFIFVHAIEEF